MQTRDDHPDPNSLAAFADGSVRKAERSDLLDHLAECGECRTSLKFLLENRARELASRRPRFQYSKLAWAAATLSFVFCAVIFTRNGELRPRQQGATVLPMSSHRSYSFEHVRLGPAYAISSPKGFLRLANVRPSRKQIVLQSALGERWISFESATLLASQVGPAGTAN